MQRWPLAVLVSLLGASGPAAAQTPAAPDFVVNTTTADGQARPSVSMDARGHFVIVWQSQLQDGSLYGVFGQRLDAAGARVGGEFRVNTTTLGNQLDPDLAVDPRGDFVVAWTDFQADADVKVQRFDRSGVAVGAEFRANSYTTGSQAAPAVAFDAGGNFVVVWESLGQDGNGTGVFGHRFGASGNSIGSDFSVNTYTTLNQETPDVIATADGGFVVFFEGLGTNGGGIHARRFDAGGTPIGGQFPVAATPGLLFEPAAAAQPQGGFVVTWSRYLPSGSYDDVFARVFDANAAPLTGDFQVNTQTTNLQLYSSVAVDGRGNFTVVWQSYAQDGPGFGVFGKRYLASGAPRGAEFRLNEVTASDQSDPVVAVDSAGSFVGAWASFNQDNSGTAVVDRRFQGLLPVSLAVNTAAGGNGMLEPNETVSFAPSWRNGTAGTQTFQGTLSSFTGPGPATYGIPDANADYGPAAPGAVRSCFDGANCYSLTVTASTRPVQHWDATALETPSGTPNADGLQKRWVVHVGDSFTDVPRTSPFYRFVETLIHNGVTGGCGPTIFCPAAFTPRDSMAVFVLVAREGAGYIPPACGTPIFNDVPAISTFCRYVEELARRGVVGGCGNGNYCPNDPVTREQMCVFVLRTLDPAFTPPPCGTPVFNDVPASSLFCPWVEELARRGVVSGCGNGNFCPTLPVTREQTSVFITVPFGLTLYGN
jgi:hypothetical protein